MSVCQEETLMFSSLNVIKDADYTFYTTFQDHQYKVCELLLFNNYVSFESIMLNSFDHQFKVMAFRKGTFSKPSIVAYVMNLSSV